MSEPLSAEREKELRNIANGKFGLSHMPMGFTGALHEALAALDATREQLENALLDATRSDLRVEAAKRGFHKASELLLATEQERDALAEERGLLVIALVGAGIDPDVLLAQAARIRGARTTEAT